MGEKGRQKVKKGDTRIKKNEEIKKKNEKKKKEKKGEKKGENCMGVVRPFLPFALISSFVTCAVGELPTASSLSGARVH